MKWLAQRFELGRGGGAHNVRPMEGMRGFAVFLVFLVHYVALVRPWFAVNAPLPGWAAAMHTIGNTGVDLFFVLSGYLIYGSLLARPQRFGRFMARRVERIYPAFLAVFAIYAALSFVLPAESKIPAPASAGALYLAANLLLLPGLFPIEPMNTVAWSLSYEMFYYLAIPLVIGVAGLRGRGTAWRVVFFSIVTAATVVYCAAFGGHVRLIMFVSGILLYEAMQGGRFPVPGGFTGLLALAAGLAVTLVPAPGFAGQMLKITALFVSFFLLCLACFARPGVWLARAFSWTPLRWLGNMSYSYYLLHGLSLKGGFLVLARVVHAGEHGLWFFWGMLPVMFAVTLVPTAGLFLLVERPFSLAPKRAAGRARELPVACAAEADAP